MNVSILKTRNQHAAGQINDLRARSDHRCDLVVGTNRCHPTRGYRDCSLTSVLRNGGEDHSTNEHKIFCFGIFQGLPVSQDY